MSFTYDLTTDVGKVRMLIPDRVAPTYTEGGAVTTGYPFFEDEEITALLTMESNVVKDAAALALETMASDEAFVQKVIRLMDLSTNGAATAAALMARAARLREQADAEEAASTTTAEFDWAELVYNDFSSRERIDKEALRDG